MTSALGSVETNLPFPNNYASEMLIIDRGEGVYLFDRSGKKYLDFGSGIAVNALGYGNETIAEITYEQMKKITHVSNLYATEPSIALGNLLINICQKDAVHFGNSGTEANEAALKYARLYCRRRRGDHAVKILSFTNGFHGRTMGALSVTPKEAYQKPFLPLIPEVYTSEYNNIDALEAILDDSFAAVIVEVVQGEGGLAVMTPEFAESLNRLTERYDVVLIADEVQTGVGRTGSFLASESVGLKPHVITLSKPLAGGLPLSATLIDKKINDEISLGDHGTTFGGGPVTTAVARHIVSVVNNDKFLNEVKEKGEYLYSQLQNIASQYECITAVHGKGLLCGLEIKEDRITNLSGKIITYANESGLLLLKSGTNRIRFAPPLIITKEEIDNGLTILKNILENVHKENI